MASDNEPITIDCDTCVMRRTSACTDCVVTFLLDVDHRTVVIDLAEARALRLLADEGLVPGLRHRPESHASAALPS